jgi:tRNA (guanine-N7-)-methyltransferase
MPDKPGSPDRTPRVSETDRQCTIELRSFGRRRGRRLRPHQAALVTDLLPRLKIDLTRPSPPEPARLFPGLRREVWLEIGFGGGEHLIWQAKHNPDIGIIGCEPFIDGVAKVLSEIDRLGIENIRLLADDARDLIRWLPSGSITRAFILFPDPWPKLRHHKRRLVNVALISELARVMCPRAELRMASDIGNYTCQMLAAAIRSGAFSWRVSEPADWRRRPADWPMTRYEQKAERAGRRCYFLTFVRQG